MSLEGKASQMMHVTNVLWPENGKQGELQSQTSKELQTKASKEIATEALLELNIGTESQSLENNYCPERY